MTTTNPWEVQSVTVSIFDAFAVCDGRLRSHRDRVEEIEEQNDVPVEELPEEIQKEYKRNDQLAGVYEEARGRCRKLLADLSEEQDVDSPEELDDVEFVFEEPRFDSVTSVFRDTNSIEEKKSAANDTVSNQVEETPAGVESIEALPQSIGLALFFAMDQKLEEQGADTNLSDSSIRELSSISTTADE